MWLAIMSTGPTSIERDRHERTVQRCRRWPWPPRLASVKSIGRSVTPICARALVKIGCAAPNAPVNAAPDASITSGRYHVVLDSAPWDDDPSLALRLAANACGQATTVHRLLANFDRFGWLRRRARSRRDWNRRCDRLVASAQPRARYYVDHVQTRPQALDGTGRSVPSKGLSLPVAGRAQSSRMRRTFPTCRSGQEARAVSFRRLVTVHRFSSLDRGREPERPARRHRAAAGQTSRDVR